MRAENGEYRTGGQGDKGTRRQGDKETRRQTSFFLVSPSPCLLFSLSPCLPLPTPYSLISTFSSTANQNKITPPTRITPHKTSAIANDPVKCAMNPVSIGASIAPILPPKF